MNKDIILEQMIHYYNSICVVNEIENFYGKNFLEEHFNFKQTDKSFDQTTTCVKLHDYNFITLFETIMYSNIEISHSELLSMMFHFTPKLNLLYDYLIQLYNTKYSLVKHNGNEDSKMNKSQRDLSPIHTWGFIDEITKK